MNVTSEQNTEVNYIVSVLLSSITIVSFVVNLVYIIVCYKTLRSNLHHLLILSLCFSDSILTLSALLYSLGPLFAFLRENILACTFQLFLIFYGLLLDYCMLFLLCIQRFYALLTNNFGNTQKKLDRYRYQLVSGTIVCLFLFEIAVCLFIPKTESLKACSVPYMYGKYGSVFTGLNIVPLTIFMVMLFVMYLSASRVIWRKFFNKKVQPLNNQRIDPNAGGTSQMLTGRKGKDVIIGSKNQTQKNNKGNRTECVVNFDLSCNDDSSRSSSKSSTKDDISVIKLDLNTDETCFGGQHQPYNIINKDPKVSTTDRAKSYLNGGSRYNLTLGKRQPNTTENTNKDEYEQTKKAQRQAWEIRAFSTCVLLACQTILLTGPLIAGFWNDVIYDKPLSIQIKLILSIPYVLNSLSNPIIYTWRIPEIRQAFKTVCSRQTSID